MVSHALLRGSCCQTAYSFLFQALLAALSTFAASSEVLTKLQIHHVPDRFFHSLENGRDLSVFEEDASNGGTALLLLQAVAKYQRKPVRSFNQTRRTVFPYVGLRSVRGHALDLAEFSGSAQLIAADDDSAADVCGVRLMMPQLQFELEVYRRLGVIRSQFSRCRVPSTSGFLMYTQLSNTSTYQHAQSLFNTGPRMTGSVRTRGARIIVVIWGIAALYCVSSFALGAFSGLQQKVVRLLPLGRLKADAERGKVPSNHLSAIQAAWRQRTLGGFALSWLDPIIGLYKSKRATEIDAKELNALEPDFQFEPYTALRKLWQEEVAAEGLEKASLLDTIRRFVGVEAMVQMLMAVGASMVLEMIGMTVVLDLLLNYLRWASDAHVRLPFVSLDLLGPSVMVIFLGFGVPLATRFFGSMASVCDGYHNNRIASGLLGLVCEKAHRLPASEPNELLADVGGVGRIDVNHLVCNDLIKIWSGAVKSYAQLVVAPCLMFIFVGILVHRLRAAAMLGLLSMVWIMAFYTPVRDAIRRANLRWLYLADARSRLTKETIFNIRSVKSMIGERELTERIQTVRSLELKSKLAFSLLQACISVPLMLFPFAFVCSSLLCYTLTGDVLRSQDIFTCMQVLAGLVMCTTVFNGAVQRTINLPNGIRRIERFLKEPEKPKKPVKQQNTRHPSAPVVQLRGSFAFGVGQDPAIKEVDLMLPKGEMVAVVGEVGSGKSALLSAMLGEMRGTDEKAWVDSPEDVAYCAQTPWMVDGMLHDNITLGDEVIDEEKYEEALAAASLTTRDHGSSIWPVAGRSQKVVEETPFVNQMGAAGYFRLWNVLSVAALLLGIANVDWSRTPTGLGILIVLIQAILHWSVLEIPLQTIATFFSREVPKPKRADGSGLSLCINYNLLAVSQLDVEECLENQCNAFLGNVSENVSAVLVSATNDPSLKEYELQVRDECRQRIFQELVHEGLVWAGLERGEVDPGRLDRVWKKYDNMDKQEFVQSHLTPLCQRFAKEFMVLHRVSRVLRKCGQYQDLMLLSAGYDLAFTYCDEKLYGSAGRKLGEPLFYDSEDCRNCFNRKWDYTLTLDADTCVIPGSVFDMLDIGAGNPERAIIQPAITMDCRPGDSLFIHIESMRQTISAPLTNTLTAVLGQSGFYGKGLLNNSEYLARCVGTPEAPIEVVPIDVLSHDTFEASVVGPLYAGDVSLLEAPCGNYVTWDIRERRWNRGEILLAMYFFPRSIGAPMRWFMGLLQGKAFRQTEVRTKAQLNEISEYLAHSALRQIILKPMLVVYIIIMDFVELRYHWTPLLSCMFLIIVFPKFATGNKDNIRAVLLETTASILQFTPECVVGTIRILRALKAHLTGNARWVPQRAVEEEFEQSNPFVFSMGYLWHYPCFAFLAGILVSSLIPNGIFIMWMFGTLFTLPFYAGFTALKTRKADEEPTPFPYFKTWNFFAFVVLVAGFLNINWSQTPLLLGMFVVGIQGMLHWSVMEIPLQTIATFFHRKPPKPKRADGSNLTMCLNYNLLATGRSEVEECMANMELAYLGNISETVSAALVSATNNPELKDHELKIRDECRERIYSTLRTEGLVWAGFESGKVDPGRLKRVWSKFQHIERQEFAQVHLEALCRQFAKEFMVLHRVSRVLRKCGQYQDLMLLSAGLDKAFTYCDKSLYFQAARPAGELLFYPSEDVENVKGRNFDYTLVLDADTGVMQDSVFELLDIGAGNPERAIIQPAITMDCRPGDSLFIHLEAMRQTISAPLTNALTSLLGQSGFYGKGVVKNAVYIEKCLGTPEEPIEVVPIDVLSHDTFEAAVVGPLYAGDVSLLEAPCGNYVTWDIRERRWNRGEILLAQYFFPDTVGKCMEWLQNKLQGKATQKTKVRTEAQLGHVSCYLAHAALRQIALKPLLVLYIISMDFVEMHYEWTPFMTCMFLIIVFPKFATCNRSNMWAVLLETTASILQFTPECVVGTIRILRALKAHLTGNALWIPQRAVEEEFEKSNPFIFSLNYLWYYPCFAVVAGALVAALIPEGIFIMWMLGTLFTLPLYAGFTALRTNVPNKPEDDDDLVEKSLAAASQRLPQEEGGKNTVKQPADSTALATTDVDTANTWLERVQIGPRGAHLSTGERIQISIARAAYRCQSELVLLDDPFASMDAASCERILERLANSRLFTDRTRVVTMPPRPELLKHFDRVIVVESGRIVADGTPSEVAALSQSQEIASKQEADTTDAANSLADVQQIPSSGPRLLGNGDLPVDLPEAQGRQTWNAFLDVALAGGPHRLVAAGFMVVLLRAAVVSQVLLLSVWADRKEAQPSVGDSSYIRALGTCVISAGALQATQHYLIQTFNNAASASLFGQAYTGVMQAPVDSFWGRQPVGRVINRLTGDMLTIDASFSSGFLSMASFIFNVSVQQVYCIMIMPKWLVLPIYSAVAAFVFFCWNASTPLQYYSVMSLSKCQEENAHLSQAAASARAFRHQGRHIAQYCGDASSVVKPNFFGVACAKQWLVFRMTFCLCFQCTVCMLCGIFQPSGKSIGTLAMIALSTFGIMQELDGFVDTLIGGMSSGISLQRLSEYFRKPPASGSQGSRALPDAAAKEQALDIVGKSAKLEVRSLRIGYSGRFADAVQGITFDLDAGHWLGLVGPTGAGKTALLLGLARIMDPREGAVNLGGWDLLNRELVSSELMRRLVRYVSQEPAIFDGTLRFNLDPSGACSDERLWEVLKLVQMHSHFKASDFGLDQSMARGGGLSLGQRQLLCFARAICEEPALMLLDGCLSSVDAKTQRAVRRALATALPRTSVVIATSRVESALDVDHLLFLENGVVVGRGSAKEPVPNGVSEQK
eukprot:TRINITY_DN37712_c0_g1_i1.p1 TRINITY_DN37712_c0_g1~~TRINITY_DN37712_c0_g1_i1.p1  ORF type:complete len:2828 (+),score=530.43 TRINITY_DN37712_c0_g1_i1:139-8622(+)